MSNGNKQEVFNLEARLNELNLTPDARNHAIGAMRLAHDVVEIFEALRATFKRIAGMISPKPRVRA